MRSRSMGRLMSAYLGCRHVPRAVMANFLGTQQVNILSRSVRKATASKPPSPVKSEKHTIKIGKKTYVINKEKLSESPRPHLPSISEAEMNLSVENKDVILRMKDSVLNSLPNLPILHDEKPFLAPEDSITKMASYHVSSDSPPYLALAKEILSPKEKKSFTVNRFDLQTDDTQQRQDLNCLMREYFLKGYNTLSVLNPDLERFWESLKPILINLTNVQCFEGETTHPILKYAHRFECIANYKGVPSIISVQKISNRNQHKIHKLELVACAAAFNFDPQWPIQVENFVLILPKSDGSPATVYVLNNENASVYWKECSVRIEQFWKNPYTLVLIDERMRAYNQHQYEPDLHESRCNTKQSSAETITDSVLNYEDIGNKSIAEDKDQHTSMSCVNNYAKPDIKKDTQEEEKWALSAQHKEECQRKLQPEIGFKDDSLGTGGLSSQKATSSQCNNADSESKEGVLKSFWNLWKSK